MNRRAPRPRARPPTAQGGRHGGSADFIRPGTDEPIWPRVPRPDVLAVRVRDQAEKAALLAGDPKRFFTEPHYNGFPAVLVRLPAVTRVQLRKLIFDAWRCQAPRQLVKDHEAARPRKRRGL